MSKLNSTENATILVVDDVPGNLALMSDMLKDDYKVKIANSGEKALKIAAADSPPDLILLDIMMPGMDGFEVCQRLKRDSRTMNIPVIFLTAKNEGKDEKKGFELGAVDYITKPINPSVVMARIKNHLALQEQSSRKEADARGWLKKSLKSLITQLDKKLPEERCRVAVTIDQEKLNAVCDKLETMLVNDDMDAVEVMNANAELLNDAFPIHCREIDNHIRSFDFVAALAVLRAASAQAEAERLTDKESP